MADTEQQVINVTEDGGIVKKILRAGEGSETPGKGADVTGIF